MAQRVKRLLAVRETWVRSLGWEAPLEKAMQPTPVLLPAESHRQRTWWATVHGVAESDMTEQLHFNQKIGGPVSGRHEEF